MSDNNYTSEQYQALRYSNEQFDKNVLFIASGALGISFAFIEKVVPDLQNASHSHFLIISWSFFAGVIFISLVAHFISIWANRWAIEHNKNDNNYDKVCRKWNRVIRGINILMILGLLLGIIWLIRFVNINI
jgi:hypothetical protein